MHQRITCMVRNGAELSRCAAELMMLANNC